MTAAVFDTHAAVTPLRGAGFDERQAEGVATKADIKDLRGEIKHIEGRIEDVEGRMATKEDLAGLETRMSVRFFGGLLAVVANTGLMVALMKLLP